MLPKVRYGCFIESYKLKQTSDWRLAALFWIAVSAGFFLKGVTLLVSGLTIAGLVLIERDIRWLKTLRAFRGLCFLILSTTAWVFAASIANHGNYLMLLFKKDLLPKIMHGVEQHGAPPGYYLGLSLILFFPGSLLFWFAIRYAWQQRKSIDVHFLFAWIIPTWLFYVFMPTKLPQYVLPLYPAVALLIAAGIFSTEWNKVGRLFKAVNYLQFLIWTAIGLAFAAIPIGLTYFIEKQVSPLAIVTASVFLLGLIIAIIFFLKKEFTQSIMVTVGSLAVCLGITAQWILPNSF